MSLSSRPARQPNPYTLQRRLLVILLGSLTLVCILLGLLYNAGMRQTLMSQLNEQLNQAANRAATYSTPQHASHDLFAPGQASGTLNARFVDGNLTAGAWLDERTGDIITITEDDVKPLLSLEVNSRPVARTLSLGNYLLLARPDQGSGGVLITGLPTEPTENALREMAWLTLMIGVLTVISTGLAGTWAIGRSFAPLKRVAAVASSVARTDLETGQVELKQRVAPHDAIPGTEVGNVGRALNALIDNVDSALKVRDRSQAQMRQFVADASHELRTPLSAIRGYTELLSATEHFSDDGRRSVNRVLEQSSRMSTLVEQLLLLARLEESTSYKMQPANLVALAKEITEDFELTSTDHQWSFAAQSPHVPVNCDSPALRRVITNLLGNARKHTSVGNSVAVNVAIDRAARDAVLTVADTGEGIVPEFLPHVFDRFTRADSARSGSDGTTGLGLPIARSIVEAHQGSITVSSEPGHTVFEVRLPLANGVDQRQESDDRD